MTFRSGFGARHAVPDLIRLKRAFGNSHNELMPGSATELTFLESAFLCKKLHSALMVRTGSERGANNWADDLFKV
jgi:hypothetical protein